MAIDETSTDRTAVPRRRKRSRPETVRIKLKRQIDRRTVSIPFVACVECGYIQNGDPGMTRDDFAVVLGRDGWKFDADIGAFICCGSGGDPVSDLI